MTNLRDPNKYLNTIWDWTPFNQCFGGTHIRITDIDGAVERNGKFLFIETKLPGQELPTGQRIFFDKLVKIPGITVLVVWGRPNQPIEAQVWNKSKRGKTDFKQLAAYLTRWFAWADQQKGG